ncbi:GIY-YIG nuclease family protein [Burkholderia sp. BCC0097]|uniref:GIY-YIG nuclease family protein n=1 Tax=Burkholderia sp. BCC0097 TaxID=2676289 RepID=UPI00158B4CE8|nr:GIY-YIG nuclease family protein [Burkholderia sp. BCC0097]
MTINKYWKDEFNEYDYDDFKSSQVEWERQRQQNSVVGWIYIGVDLERPGRAKIGLTTGELGTRASSPQNPFYTLFYAFKIKEGVSATKIHEIEDAAKQMLWQRYQRIVHIESGQLSEWFYVDPYELRELLRSFLYENYSMYMYCYHCSERDIGVIESWENNRLINGGDRIPYQPMDLSSPPVSSECLTPPGCGADCNCWS